MRISTLPPDVAIKLAAKRRNSILYVEDFYVATKSWKNRISSGSALFILPMTMMKNNLVLSHEGAYALERSIGLLQDALREMRRLAFGMMPERVLTMGLDAAVRQKCEEVNLGGNLQVTYRSQGLEGFVPDADVSAAVYRIIQALLKHAAADTSARYIDVDLRVAGGLVKLQLTDHGRGFDPMWMSYAEGTGLANILRYVDALKGNMRVDSSRGNGTRVHIDVKI